MIHNLAAQLGERLGFGARAVPDGHVMAGLDQPFGHGCPHAPRPDPTDLVLVILTVRRHCMLLAKAPDSASSLITGRKRRPRSKNSTLGKTRRALCIFLTEVYGLAIRARALAQASR